MKRPIKKKSALRQQEIETLMNPRTARKFERDAENALIDLEEKTDTVYKFAREIFLLQDEKTRAVVERMTETMGRMAGPPAFRFRGVSYNASRERQEAIQEKLFVALAIRLLTACALWDIQIANFKLPADRCAKCGTTVKPTRRRKR